MLAMANSVSESQSVVSSLPTLPRSSSPNRTSRDSSISASSSDSSSSATGGASDERRAMMMAAERPLYSTIQRSPKPCPLIKQICHPNGGRGRRSRGNGAPEFWMRFRYCIAFAIATMSTANVIQEPMMMSAIAHCGKSLPPDGPTCRNFSCDAGLQYAGEHFLQGSHRRHNSRGIISMALGRISSDVPAHLVHRMQNAD